MPNLMLTNWCNYKCPYCFGKDMMHPKLPALNMQEDTFEGIIQWLNKDRQDNVIHLMGGEPTLHPHFEKIVQRLMEEEFKITVFSNLATDQAPSLADKLNLFPVRWVVNVNNPVKWSEKQRHNIESSLALLADKACLTFNVMPDGSDDNWALDLTEKYNLEKYIKVGFLLPTYEQSNMALNDNEYATVATKVTELAIEAAKRDIRLEYECGVPTCAFTDEQLGTLWKCGSPLSSGCCSRLDITPDGWVIYCLPLATMGKKKYYEFENYSAAKDWHEKRYAPYRAMGRTTECAMCPLRKSDSCNAACLAKNLIGCSNIDKLKSVD